MRILTLLFFLAAFHSQAQQDIESAFDFWVGEWKAEWLGADSNIVVGSNVITKIAGDGVIHENFADTTTGFFGTSISVYGTADSTWKQVWMDNAGAYIELEGIIEDDRRIFQTQPQLLGGNQVVRRMVFYNIAEDSFTWDWEAKPEGQENWNLLWRIQYTRKTN